MNKTLWRSDARLPLNETWFIDNLHCDKCGHTMLTNGDIVLCPNRCDSDMGDENVSGVVN